VEECPMQHADRVKQRLSTFRPSGRPGGSGLGRNGKMPQNRLWGTFFLPGT
jgi:hypothetical protein